MITVLLAWINSKSGCEYYGVFVGTFLLDLYIIEIIVGGVN